MTEDNVDKKDLYTIRDTDEGMDIAFADGHEFTEEEKWLLLRDIVVFIMKKFDEEDMIEFTDRWLSGSDLTRIHKRMRKLSDRLSSLEERLQKIDSTTDSTNLKLTKTLEVLLTGDDDSKDEEEEDEEEDPIIKPANIEVATEMSVPKPNVETAPSNQEPTPDAKLKKPVPHAVDSDIMYR